MKRLLAVYGISKELVMLSGIVLLTRFMLFCIKAVMLIILTGFVIDRSEDRAAAASEDIELPVGRIKEWFVKRLGRVRTNKKVRKVRKVVTVVGAAALVVYGVLFLMSSPDLHEPIVIGHRGSSGGVENTVEAVQGAIDAKADYAEIDAYLSEDKVPVISHDASLKRLTGEDINVYDKTAEELKQLTLSQNGMEGSICTLAEMLEYSDGKIQLAIELKTYGDEGNELVEKVLEVVENSGALDRVIFLSLDYDLVKAVKQLNKEAVVGYCVYQNVGKLQSNILISMDIDFIVIEEGMADYETVYNFRKAWIPVYVWTVNDTSNMQEYLEMGAIGIVSDNPDEARAAVDMFLQVSKGSYLEKEEWE